MGSTDPVSGPDPQRQTEPGADQHAVEEQTSLAGNGDDIVPLKPDFDVVWHGYERSQVRHYVRQAETDLRLLEVDRDAAMAQAEDATEHSERMRTQNDQLRERFDVICRTPVDAGGLDERLRRMVALAEAEAAEIVDRARAATEERWAAAEQAAGRVREQYECLLDELDRQRRAMEAEHRELTTRTRDHIDATDRRAEERRRQLDEEAANHRRQVQRDFETAMAARRSDALNAIARQEAEAKVEAARLVRAARAHANGIIAGARQQVESLREVRTRMAEQLGEAVRLSAAARRDRKSVV